MTLCKFSPFTCVPFEACTVLFTISLCCVQVWTCCISTDSELLVSGSRDQTIRLWKLSTGQQISSFNTGVDVFTVKISNDKKTIVALGDKFHTRKLIMLQVVVKKIRSRAGSRATSPLSHQGSPPPVQHTASYGSTASYSSASYQDNGYGGQY